MSYPRSTIRLVLGILAVVLVATSCGSDGDSSLPDTTLDSSPINDLLGIDITLRSDDLVELERAAERGVVECMAEAGFEYRPLDFAEQLGRPGPADPDSREFAETSGYGIFASPDTAEIDPNDFVDPNDEIRAGLSPTELDAYQLALYGDAPVEGEQISLDERTGCVATSYRAVYDAEDDMERVEDFFNEFGVEFNEIEQRFRADPRYGELQEQWSDCMAEAGYQFATRDAVFIELNERANAAGPIESDGATATLDAVADWERAVATADWDCTQDVDEQLRRLRFGYEALFLQENEEQLNDA